MLKGFRCKGGGTSYIQIKCIWSDVLDGVGTPHKILRQMLKQGWGHRKMLGVLGGGNRTFKEWISGQMARFHKVGRYDQLRRIVTTNLAVIARCCEG